MPFNRNQIIEYISYHTCAFQYSMNKTVNIITKHFHSIGLAFLICDFEELIESTGFNGL